MLLFIGIPQRNPSFVVSVSIHLMLLFIRLPLASRLSPVMFQYISCYSLSYRVCNCDICLYVSIHLMLLFIDGLILLHGEVIRFQYISCYSLSISGEKEQCLSGVSIHLMLLFIVNLPEHLYNVLSFNTSHVTLYPVKEKLPDTQRILVSIHLMLLFIDFA